MRLFNRFLILLFLIFGVSARSATLPTSDWESCKALLALAGAELGGVKSDFLQKHNSRYGIEVAKSPIRNQCSFGGCWAYSTVAEIEGEIFRKTGKRTQLSEQYIILRNLKEKALAALETPNQHMSGAGTVASAEWLIQKYGIVPTEVWKPRIDFENAPHSVRILEFLNAVIAKYQIERHALSPLAIGPSRKLKESAQKQIDEVISVYSGEFPEHFSVEGVEYTSPKQYAENEILKGREQITVLTPLPVALPDRLRKTQTPFRDSKVSGKEVETHNDAQAFEAIEQNIVKALQAGEVVPMAYENARVFFDKGTGIMSIAAFHTPEGYSPAPVEYRKAFDLADGTHAVDIVGADLDSDGHVIKFKIRNSWGEKLGDAGYFHMYQDYFREYFRKAYIKTH